MVIGGLCQNCGKFSPGLFTCKSCGSKVCPNCVMPNSVFCMICKGRKMR